MKPRRKSVAVPASLAAEIDQLVGKENRNAFALEIVEREINRLKARRALGEPSGNKEQE